MYWILGKNSQLTDKKLPIYKQILKAIHIRGCAKFEGHINTPNKNGSIIDAPPKFMTTFDSVNREYTCHAPWKKSIPEKLIVVMRVTYKGA